MDSSLQNWIPRGAALASDTACLSLGGSWDGSWCVAVQWESHQKPQWACQYHVLPSTVLVSASLGFGEWLSMWLWAPWVSGPQHCPCFVENLF